MFYIDNHTTSIGELLLEKRIGGMCLTVVALLSGQWLE